MTRLDWFEDSNKLVWKFCIKFLHERKLKNVLFHKKAVLRENHLNRQSKIRRSPFSYIDVMKTNILEVVTPASIYQIPLTTKKASPRVADPEPPIETTGNNRRDGSVLYNVTCTLLGIRIRRVPSISRKQRNFKLRKFCSCFWIKYEKCLSPSMAIWNPYSVMFWWGLLLCTDSITYLVNPQNFLFLSEFRNDLFWVPMVSAPRMNQHITNSMVNLDHTSSYQYFN